MTYFYNIIGENSAVVGVPSPFCLCILIQRLKGNIAPMFSMSGNLLRR